MGLIVSLALFRGISGISDREVDFGSDLPEGELTSEGAIFTELELRIGLIAEGIELFTVNSLPGDSSDTTSAAVADWTILL